MTSSNRLELYELPNKQRIGVESLKALLPDVATAVFFAKVYKMDVYALSNLLSVVCQGSVQQALDNPELHSTSLQDYLLEVGQDYGDVTNMLKPVDHAVPDPDEWELLPHLFEAAMVQVAQSITDVADKLVGTIGRLPSKDGRMILKQLYQVNLRRPTIGVSRAQVSHVQVPSALVVLDVSGSMSRETVKAIIADVVGLAWKADAHLAIVSNRTFHWDPGAYDVNSVLAKAEFSGTQYETLAPLFNRDWGSVITIADYDSGWQVKEVLGACSGSIGTLYDISLVERCTYLGECLSQLAEKVEPLLVAQRSLCRY